MDKKEFDAFIADLEAVANGVKQPPRLGICWYVDTYWKEAMYTLYSGNYCVYVLLQGAFADWKHHSGNFNYPVPVPESEVHEHDSDPKYYYDYIDNISDLSMWDGEYGDLRKDLLKYLIGKLKDRYNELGE